MRQLILLRHAHSASNAADVVSGAPPGDGLSPLGIEQARALRDALVGVTPDLGLATELRRTQETLKLALAGTPVPSEVFAGLNEIGFGAFEGGSLGRYRDWAWATRPDAPCPGGGESRADVAARLGAALDELLERPEHTILAVSHALPVRYVVDAVAGLAPRCRIEAVPHAEPFRLDVAATAVAAATLHAWSRAPRFRNASFEG